MKSRLEQLLDELLRQIDIPAMEQAVSEQYKSQIADAGNFRQTIGCCWSAAVDCEPCGAMIPMRPWNCGDWIPL